MKRLFLIAILLGGLYQANAQKMTEIGIGVRPYSKNLHTYLEHSLTNKYTLSAEFGLEWSPLFVNEFDTDYERRNLELSLGVKHYFSEDFKKWFLASHLKYTHRIYIQEDFPNEKKWNETLLNFISGYKWVTKPGITIETSLGLEVYRLTNSNPYVYLNFFAALRLGYRFGG